MTTHVIEKWIRRFVHMLLFTALFLLAGGNLTQAYGAQDQRLFDHAQLLKTDERTEIEEEIAQCREKTGMDVVVLTAYNDGNRSARDYADDFYDQGGYGTGKKASGVLFLLYMDGPQSKGGECWISTSGNMIRILTDKRIEDMQEHVADSLRGQSYGSAVRTFLADIEYYVDKGIQRGQYNYDTETGEISVYRSIRWYEAAFAVLLPGFIAGSVCLGIKKRYNMEETGRERTNSLLAYRAESSFRFAESGDSLLNKFVTTTPIPRVTIQSSSGGGSSGRSSTHTSSGGRSHGGGGRRF